MNKYLMEFIATVNEVSIDPNGCGWVGLDVTLRVGERICTTCAARVAVPIDENDNPWSRQGESWTP